MSLCLESYGECAVSVCGYDWEWDAKTSPFHSLYLSHWHELLSNMNNCRAWTVVCTAWTIVQHGPLYSMDCCLAWPLSSMDHCTAWTVVQHGPLSSMDCCTAWTVVQNGSLYSMDCWQGLLSDMNCVVWHGLCYLAWTVLFDMDCVVWHGLLFGMDCVVWHGLYCLVWTVFWHGLLSDMDCVVLHGLLSSMNYVVRHELCYLAWTVFWHGLFLSLWECSRTASVSVAIVTMLLDTRNCIVLISSYVLCPDLCKVWCVVCPTGHLVML